MNRLSSEKSPYLLQHRSNPVDWYPWGNEAFERAKVEDRPIFLSIGYSTCHWCHVMERESFEDDEVAHLMNEAFVSIKVDREERPDIDNLYMTVCHMMGGHCGWPLNVILTPEMKPFFSATYIPKASRHGRIGMMELIPRVAGLWTERRDEVLASASEITTALRGTLDVPSGSGNIDEDWLTIAFSQLSDRYDPVRGGFGSAPKFPSPHNLLFLLRYWSRTGDDRALEMASRTLECMRLGGMYDHIGFGFHRYSTDATWLLPHFEKMLYDQAMLVLAYIEGYQATGNESFARTAREVLSYVARDMQSREGGFYSAEDADSEGVEGKFYVWSVDELGEVLGSEDAAWICEHLNAAQDGNIRDEATGRPAGENILFLKNTLADAETERWSKIRERLFEHRERRIHPPKDDKILADWNGLMIAAFAKAGAVLGEPGFTATAAAAADFILSAMRTPEGRLLHRWRDGDGGLVATSTDYTFMIWGLIELYEASVDLRYLEAAIELNEVFLDHFEDPGRGGFFISPDDGEELLARQKELHDSAIPSSNSIAFLNLLRLSRMTGRTELDGHALGVVNVASAQVRRAPSAFTGFLMGVDMAIGPTFEVVVCGSEQSDDTREMLAALRREYTPNSVVLFKDDEGDAARLADLAPFTTLHKSIDGKATAYVCRNYACNLPTTDIEKMMGQMEIRNF